MICKIFFGYILAICYILGVKPYFGADVRSEVSVSRIFHNRDRSLPTRSQRVPTGNRPFSSRKFLLRFSSVRPFVRANLILTERNIPCKIPSSGGTSRSSERGALCSWRDKCALQTYVDLIVAWCNENYEKQVDEKNMDIRLRREQSKE